MRFGFVGPSYTARSTVMADEECINWFAETAETTAASVSPSQTYGGQSAQGYKNYLGTPGLEIFKRFPGEGPIRALWEINGRCFVIAATKLYEIDSAATITDRGDVANDGQAATIVSSSIQLLIVSAGLAYCYDLATDVLTDVTSLLAGTPGTVAFSDSYFIVNILNTNKFQISDVLNGLVWPGLQVNEVSVFPENIVSIAVNHRELWVFGGKHTQPYQDTGSDEIFDVIGGTLIEKGCSALFSPVLLDNSVFWIDQDERGNCTAQRSNGYVPARVSTHAIEIDLQSYTPDQVAKIVSYTYQDGGHLFWMLYIPKAEGQTTDSWCWCYDVGESLWHKRAFWESDFGPYTPHRSWNHVFAFGKHLVGDWNSPNLYQMKMPVDNGDGSYSFVTDAGSAIRRLRRSPTIISEMNWIRHARVTLDFQTGLGPQPPLQDGDGNDRQPQVMLRWSDNRGATWSNEHIADCGFAGEYNKRVIFYRLGQSRYRVYEMSVSDPIIWVLVDAYLDIAA